MRRLYDIANILTSMDLIKKKVFVVAHHLKKSGYCWSGPSVKEIDQVCSSEYWAVVITLSPNVL